MSRAVLISIRPEWCEKIADGEKTIEVRKTRPKMDTPLKCYIYRTKGTVPHIINGKWVKIEVGGTVVGEFVCDKIYELAPLNHAPDDVEQMACLTREEIVQYLRGVGYGWHISDLKIYNQPKELNEFWFPPDLYCEKKLCGNCPYDQVADVNGEYGYDCEWKRPLKRAPQSWQYVEELK